MTIHVTSLSTYFPCMFYVCTRFSNTKWILSNITLEGVFLNVIGLAFIPYSSFIKGFLKSWSINSYHPPYVIYVFQGCLVIHTVSTKFTIFFGYLYIYFVISNHPVMGSIIITGFINKLSLLPFLRIFYGPIKSKHNLF